MQARPLPARLPGGRPFCRAARGAIPQHRLPVIALKLVDPKLPHTRSFHAAAHGHRPYTDMASRFEDEFKRRWRTAGSGKLAEERDKRWYSSDSDAKKDKDKEKEEDKGKTAKKEAEPDAKGPKDKKQPELPSPRVFAWTMAAAAAVAFMMAFLLLERQTSEDNKISFQEFIGEILPAGNVIALVVSGDHSMVYVYLRQPDDKEDTDPASLSKRAPDYWFTIGALDSLEARLDEAQDRLGISGRRRFSLVYESPRVSPLEVVGSAGWVVVQGLMLYWALSFVRGASLGGLMGSIGNRVKGMRDARSTSTTKFKDVAGLHEAKQEISEFVQFLKAPQKFAALGARIPKGALLVGPPGTGKTLLAKATAGEAGVPFFSVTGSEFNEMYVGVGAARVRDLFEKARKNSPSIIFIDEIDAVGRKRDDVSVGHDERDSTLNALLVEMDGFTKPSEPVVVMAGTNTPQSLDPALTRAGRFDRTISFELPTMKDRMEIFKVHLAPIKTQEKNMEELSGKLASITPGFSGADIATICNEAALIAARGNKTEVELPDFHAAIDRLIGGIEKKSFTRNVEETKVTAYHEAGHAVAGWFLEHGMPLLKVSIVPRGKALGYAQYNPKERNLHTREQMLDNMCVTLGGRVAEQLLFGRLTTGAMDDLEKVTHSAYTQILQLGFSEKLGPVGYQDRQDVLEENLYSDATARMADDEARSLVQQAYHRTELLLTEKLEAVKAVGDELLKKEVLLREDMVRLLGPRPWPDPEDWRAYLPEAQSVKAAPAPPSSAAGLDKAPPPAPAAPAAAAPPV